MCYNTYMPTGIYQHQKGYKLSEERRKKLCVPKKGAGIYQRTEQQIENLRIHIKKISKLNIGKKHPHSLETIEKIRLSHLGKKHTEEHKRNISLGNMGKKMPDSFGENISKRMIGNKCAFGKKQTIEHRRKFSESHRGEKSYLWKGGISPVRNLIRGSFQYRNWRNEIFNNNNYTCVECGQHGGYLEADHYPVPFSAILNKLIVEQGLENLLEKALNYELFWIVENGRTLCEECHKKTDNYGFKGNRKAEKSYPQSAVKTPYLTKEEGK